MALSLSDSPRFDAFQAAICLEASDDILACIFAPLSLVERLRLLTVSKRWLCLLLVDLCVPQGNAWRAPSLAKRAGVNLRSLQLAGAGELFTRRCALRELLRALGGCSGSQMRSLVAWEPRCYFAEHCELEPALSTEQAMQLATSCPRLDGRTCLSLQADEDSAQAIAMLDALPGRHAVQLKLAYGNTGLATSQEALQVLVRHPRLQALFLKAWDDDDLADSDEDAEDFDLAAIRRSEAAAAFDSVAAAALQTGSAPSLELLSICSGSLFAAPQPAFADAAAVEAAFAAPAAAPSWTLRRLFLDGSAPCPALTRGALVASRGAIRHLRACASQNLIGDDGEDGGAKALAALLRHVGGSLESLHLCSDRSGESNETPFLPGLAPLLASPACRLHTLSVASVSLAELAFAAPLWGNEQLQDEEPTSRLQRFLAALSANRSLTALHLASCEWDEAEVELFAAALGARATPIGELRLSESYIPPAGAPPAPLCISEAPPPVPQSSCDLGPLCWLALRLSILSLLCLIGFV